MASRFEVGKTYAAADSGIDPITVIARSAKTIMVYNGTATWRMLVRELRDFEYVVDSSVPPSWRGAFTYASCWPVAEEKCHV